MSHLQNNSSFHNFNIHKNRFPKAHSFIQTQLFKLFNNFEYSTENKSKLQSEIFKVTEDAIHLIAGESDKDLALFVIENEPNFFCKELPNTTFSFIDSAIVGVTLMLSGNVLDILSRDENNSLAFNCLGSGFVESFDDFVHLYVFNNRSVFEKTIKRRSPSSDNSK